MPKYAQPEMLKPPDKPKALREFWRSRIQSGSLLNASDVSTALNISAQKVRGWCEDGTLDAANIGTREKPYWKVYRESVLRLIEELTIAANEKRS